MDPTVNAMLTVYTAAHRRHRQPIEESCDRRTWHEQARYLIERAVWSANSDDEQLRGGLRGCRIGQGSPESAPHGSGANPA
jgi:hypothetical protein